MAPVLVQGMASSMSDDTVEDKKLKTSQTFKYLDNLKVLFNTNFVP